MDLHEASELAYQLHSDQVDKLGHPYYQHAYAVRDMLTGEPDEVLIAAVLHDAVEDTDMTLEELLHRGCPARSVAAIDSVSRRPGEPYMDLIRRARDNPDGRCVKLADNFHNTSRLQMILDAGDRQRLTSKYRLARGVLLG